MSDNNPAEPIRTGSTSDESTIRRTTDEQPVVVDPITGAGRNGGAHLDADHGDVARDDAVRDDEVRAEAARARGSEPVIVEPTDEPLVSTATAETPVVTSAQATAAEPVAATDNPSAVDTRSQYILTTPAPELAETGAPVTAATPAWQPAEHPAPAPASRVVYVEAAAPPVKKSNRGFGVGVALLSTLVYAVLFALVIVAIYYFYYGAVAFSFLSSPDFVVPIVAFAVGFILLVLLLNRARLWGYLVGSLVVGIFVYFVTIGVVLLLRGVVGDTAEQASALFGQALINPVVIASALLAREVTLWAGLAISARGRRITTQNADARATFDRENSVARDGHATTAPLA